MFGTQSEEGSGGGSEEEFSSAVLGSVETEEGAVTAPEPEEEDGVEALPEWADDVLELVAQGERLSAAQDRQVTLALDLRKERASQIAAGRAVQAAAAAAEKAAETKAQENATLVAVIEAQNRRLEKQDKLVEGLAARLQAVENGAAEDLEPSFREFSPRAEDNPFGGPGVVRKGKDAEPQNRWYTGEVAFDWYKQKGGKEFHSFQSFESAAEASFDIIAHFKQVVPHVVEKQVNPERVEDESDPKYQAERELSKLYNSIVALYENVINPQLSYLQIEALLKKEHGQAADNGWISTVLQSLYRSLHGLVGAPLPANLPTKLSSVLSGMEDRFSTAITKVAAEQAARKAPVSRFQSQASRTWGSTISSRSSAAKAAATQGGSGARGGR